MKTLHKFLSFMFVLFNCLIILFFYFHSRQGYLEGAPGWILLILGAPATFLALAVFSARPLWLANILSQYLVVSFFLQLQYQVIIYLFFYRINKLRSRIIFVGLSLSLIIVFAYIMKKKVLPIP